MQKTGAKIAKNYVSMPICGTCYAAQRKTNKVIALNWRVSRFVSVYVYTLTSIGAKSSFSRPAVVKVFDQLELLIIHYIEIRTCFISKLP